MYLEQRPLAVPEELKRLLKDVGEVVEVEPANLGENVDRGDHANRAGGGTHSSHGDRDVRTERIR
jgi:hypothetical protein